MLKNILKFAMTIAAATAVSGASAQDSIPAVNSVTSAFTIEFGGSTLADTYLSPLKYHGTHYGLHYERTQPMKLNPEKFTMQTRLGINFDSDESPARNTTMLKGSINAGWAMMRRYTAAADLTLAIGGDISLDLGAIYLSRNSNNPVSAKGAITLGLTGYAAWRPTVLGKRLTLRYQPTLPLTGAFFSPDYGQLYYQIYMGDTRNLVHAAWWSNYFAMDNLLTVDVPLGRSSLRLGYRNAVLSTKVNHLVTRDITNSFVLGFTTEWISLRPDSQHINARIISAY